MSKPVACLFELLVWDSETRAWTSKMMGREPSMITVKAEPACSELRLKNLEDMSVAETKPSERISKTPISLVGPKRFLKPLRILSSWDESPSKYKTVSTICSSTLGPAIEPSFVI